MVFLPDPDFPWRCAPLNDEGLPTETSWQQETTEEVVEQAYTEHRIQDDPDAMTRPQLMRNIHAQFLKRGLQRLGCNFEPLDASKPWLCFWIVHSLQLLDVPLEDSLKQRMVNTLRSCQHPDGGFGGGPGQLAHLATTYAAIVALATLGTEEGYEMIDRQFRQKLYTWIMSLKQSDASFVMCHGGEIDIRGTYCALTAASLLNIVTDELTAGCANFVASCQTYEGGLGCRPGVEAHGGYAFCGLAAMLLLNATDKLRMPALLHWAVRRQMRNEGGFQGRTNKLVDGCYAFWCGGLFPLFREAGLGQQAGLLLNREALQDYMLCCCQYSRGGLIDKPGRRPDYYHTCYGLSGLASVFVGEHAEATRDAIGSDQTSSPVSLREIHPIFNVDIQKANEMQRYFGELPAPSSAS